MEKISIQMMMVVDTLPVIDKQIAKQSARDSTIGLVLQAIQNGGWPKAVSKELMAFHRRLVELTFSVILQGSRNQGGKGGTGPPAFLQRGPCPC